MDDQVLRATCSVNVLLNQAGVVAGQGRTRCAIKIKWCCWTVPGSGDTGMDSTRRGYTEEYKVHAVAFVNNGGRSIVEVASLRSRAGRTPRPSRSGSCAVSWACLARATTRGADVPRACGNAEGLLAVIQGNQSDRGLKPVSTKARALYCKNHLGSLAKLPKQVRASWAEQEAEAYSGFCSPGTEQLR